MMRRRRLDERGQSILEYMVIVTVVIIAIAAIRSVVQGNMTTLFNAAAAKTADAGTALSGLAVE